MKQPSQCERVLAVLRDGQWHRMEEIHQRAGFMRLNSRISDLRARGLSIECDKRGGHYRYRLVGSLRESARELGASPQADSRSDPDPGRSGRLIGAGRTVPQSCPAPPLFEVDPPNRPAWA